ncbi:serine/threonine-protein kinase [Nocardia brasiliensis]|uniref:serine/threonine-protein kinase n=1 Tax=Nocardia brasiliensis TaxID=37326 RepID=UPI002454D834|nr:serine/threonine-protein kinase [Nocardia brasiliensis]
MAMSPGTIVGGYRIDRVLGAGGMGTVYLAKHPSLPRMDALKVLSPELSSDHEFRARFEREANLAAGLDHPNIVSVYNRGEEHGQLWIAMQYVDGIDASAEIARDPHAMNPLRALRITTEVGKGLDYAHRKGLLHRDIKPANFLLSATDGDEERVLLTDFGVAKSNDDTTELTQTGSFVATIAYAPPEQLTGERLDHHADIYSLACSFFKLLTGRNPYPATQPALVMMGHLHEPPPAATAVHPGLPPAIDQVFARAMAKNPADRFNSCRELTDAAANALVPGFNPGATNTSPTYPVQVVDPRPPTDPRVAQSGSHGQAPVSPKRRKRRLIAVEIGAVVITLAAGFGIWAVSGGSSSTPDAPATPSTVIASGATSVEQARADNPVFRGKVITMVDVPRTKQIAAFLGGTAPAKFLEDLGFVYNFNYAKQGEETSPRALTTSGALEVAPDSYVLAVRSDEEAGNGGLRGLPYQVAGTRATVIVLDDPAAVAALRSWTAGSERTLLDKLVPLLRNRVK